MRRTTSLRHGTRRGHRAEDSRKQFSKQTGPDLKPLRRAIYYEYLSTGLLLDTEWETDAISFLDFAVALSEAGFISPPPSETITKALFSSFEPSAEGVLTYWGLLSKLEAEFSGSNRKEKEIEEETGASMHGDTVEDLSPLKFEKYHKRSGHSSPSANETRYDGLGSDELVSNAPG